MKRARDVRDQLAGLLERVEIELTSNESDLDAIKKSITSGKLIKTNVSLHCRSSFSLLNLIFNRCRIFPTLCSTAKEWILSNC